MDTFNNREIALGIWIVILGIFYFYKYDIKPVKEAFQALLKALFVRQIMSVVILATLYVVAIVFLINYLNLWEWPQLKNTIMWYLSIALLLVFKLRQNKKDSHFFRNLVFSNFKLVAILEFIIGLYSFNLLIELILVPIATIATIFIIVGESDKKIEKSSETLLKLLRRLLMFFGLATIIYTFYMLYNHFDDVNEIETLYNFYIPPLLTILYLPFIFLLIVYTEYEEVFSRLQFHIKDSKIRFFTKVYAILVFNIRFKLLNRWFKTLFAYKLKTFSDVRKTISKLFNQIKVEKNPPVVKKEDGWSPYLAKNFLIDFQLKTDYYHFLYDDIWSASSNVLKLNDTFFENTLSYNISGTEGIAKTINLKLYISDFDDEEEAINRFLQCVDVLFKKSIALDMLSKFTETVELTENTTIELDKYVITLERNDSEPNMPLKNYSLKLTISIDNTEALAMDTNYNSIHN